MSHKQTECCNQRGVRVIHGLGGGDGPFGCGGGGTAGAAGTGAEGQRPTKGGQEAVSGYLQDNAGGEGGGERGLAGWLMAESSELNVTLSLWKKIRKIKFSSNTFNEMQFIFITGCFCMLLFF